MDFNPTLNRPEYYPPASEELTNDIFLRIHKKIREKIPQLELEIVSWGKREVIKFVQGETYRITHLKNDTFVPAISDLYFEEAAPPYNNRLGDKAFVAELQDLLAESKYEVFKEIDPEILNKELNAVRKYGSNKQVKQYEKIYEKLMK